MLCSKYDCIGKVGLAGKTALEAYVDVLFDVSRRLPDASALTPALDPSS